MSRRECIPSIHRRNIKFIKRELRKRGVTVTPDTEPRLKLPTGSLWTRREVLQVLNSTLKASYIPLVVCDFLTSNLKLQYTAPESVLSCLDNGRKWARAINDCEDIQCCCNRPEYAGLPRRHGHIFVPSWEYTGPHEATINGSSKTLLHPNKRHRDLSTAVWAFWMHYLPSSLLPDAVRGTESLNEAEWGSPAFRAGEVYRTKRFLRHLAVLPIDKCQHRMLIE